MLFAVPAQPITPVIIKVVEQPAKEIGVADILMGAVGITGIFLIGAALLGLAIGVLLILFRTWRARHAPEDAGERVFPLTQPPDRPQPGA